MDQDDVNDYLGPTPHKLDRRAEMQKEVDALIGIKEDELNKLGPCALCKKPLLASGEISFYRLKMEQALWDVRAVNQQVGLGMMLGGAMALARIMGTNADLAKITSSKEVVVHSTCAMDKLMHMFILMEDVDGR